MQLADEKLRLPLTSFPNGWFCIAYSDEIKPEEVKPLHYFGRDLVLFRSKSGTPYVFDAHCPHLGTHLGYGGKVKGENIQCALHGWCFDGNGNCINIPYASKMPPNIQARSWSVREMHGVIMVYYHSHGSPPDWEIPELPEEPIDGNWGPFVKILHRKARTHIQDVTQGDCDLVHAKTIHRAVYIAECENIEIKGPLLYHLYSLFVKVPFPVSLILGKELKIFFDFVHCGMGYLFIKQIAHEEKGSPFQILRVFNTPIDDEYCETRIVSSIKQIVNKPITNALIPLIIYSTRIAYEEDLPILENRSRCNSPLLSYGDGPIAKYRRWARQFYPSEYFVTSKPLNS
ncbi:Rieske 2Fe-2S domain-containing protein [Brasilonema sp. UFV-L1]|uniref:Rieske 2Fe-2S domain-containing protein n=1 Tax=Brasilonema sp. UFV-L1 TaxID=2234130 RepID=UPI00145D0635|nr:Rieske 2Fe-2S domain-containing protein [Brasilonema sp. UFV-L1]